MATSPTMAAATETVRTLISSSFPLELVVLLGSGSPLPIS